ncbi:MAG TPA: crosslink repair DNA glycosylase YcaQ family protein [Acidimicrobiia bacterium]|nr:crosslink repair DNA glycosylase YcaQ family protein [Acidimicrobiia bacterium]
MAEQRHHAIDPGLSPVARRESLSAAQARRITLAAQGFAKPRPSGRITRRHLRSVFDRLGLIQIDSVNVLVRSHYLPLFSRLGPYDRSILDRFVYKDREAFEYWGHEASLVHAELHPLLRWRMESYARWGMSEFAAAQPDGHFDALHAAVLERGTASAGDLDDGATKKGPWWGWGNTKRSLEHLFARGRLGAIRRPNTFERAYCDPARVVPVEVLEQPTPSDREALVSLLERSARGHGVGTARDLGDYFRLPIKEVRTLLEEMAADGLVERVTVEGWKDPSYLHPDARLPRWVRASALVSPFDSVMWERARVERVFGFTYRIEIYVPKPKRVFGYYVLPFLLGDRFVARVDLKADRAGSRLLVQSAWAEAGVDHDEVSHPLADELRTMASWLGLDEVVIQPRGDLAPALRARAR